MVAMAVVAPRCLGERCGPVGTSAFGRPNANMAAIRTPAGIGLAYVAGVAMVAVAPVGDAVIVVACAIRLKHRPAALVDIGLRCVGIAGTIADSLAHLRTPGFDPAFILRLLDMGVQGIQVPHVSSPEMAREAAAT